MLIKFYSDEVNGSPVKGLFVSRTLFVILFLLAMALGFAMAALLRGFFMTNSQYSRPTPVISGAIKLPPQIASGSRPVQHGLAEPWLGALKDASARGNFENVIALAASASLSVPGSIVPHQYRIRSLIHLGRYQQANKAVHDAMQIFPGDSELLLTAAAFNQATNNPLAAEKLFLKALAADRYNSGVWHGLIETYMRAGLWNLASEVASMALEIFPQDPAILLSSADALRLQQDWPAAIKRYREYLTLVSENNADVCFKLALSLRLSGGSASESLSLYERAIALQPDHLAALNDCALMRASTGRKDEAVSLLPKLLELAGQNPSVLNTAGLIYFWTDQPAQAEPLLIKAQELAPESPEFAAQLAAFYSHQNNPKKSVEFKELALKLCNGDNTFIEGVNREINKNHL